MESVKQESACGVCGGISWVGMVSAAPVYSSMPRTPKEADNQPRKLFLEATRTRVHLGRVIVNSAPDSRLGESEASSAARNIGRRAMSLRHASSSCLPATSGASPGASRLHCLPRRREDHILRIWRHVASAVIAWFLAKVVDSTPPSAECWVHPPEPSDQESWDAVSTHRNSHAFPHGTFTRPQGTTMGSPILLQAVLSAEPLAVIPSHKPAPLCVGSMHQVPVQARPQPIFRHVPLPLNLPLRTSSVRSHGILRKQRSRALGLPKHHKIPVHRSSTGLCRPRAPQDRRAARDVSGERVDRPVGGSTLVPGPGLDEQEAGVVLGGDVPAGNVTSPPRECRTSKTLRSGRMQERGHLGDVHDGGGEEVRVGEFPWLGNGTDDEIGRILVLGFALENGGLAMCGCQRQLSNG
ncbi:hypothetical protein JHW43_004355 [Diplocarpon mali]|nr:hypothetical protein JHW43_004355 [Diplocarpon mali]